MINYLEANFKDIEINGYSLIKNEYPYLQKLYYERSLTIWSGGDLEFKEKWKQKRYEAELKRIEKRINSYYIRNNLKKKIVFIEFSFFKQIIIEPISKKIILNPEFYLDNINKQEAEDYLNNMTKEEMLKLKELFRSDLKEKQKIIQFPKRD